MMAPEKEKEVEALREIKEEIAEGILATTDDVVDAIDSKIEEIQNDPTETADS